MLALDVDIEIVEEDGQLNLLPGVPVAALVVEIDASTLDVEVVVGGVDLEIVEQNDALAMLPANADGVIELELDFGDPVEVVEEGPQGPPGSTGLVKVQHGSNANTSRPDVPLVYWVGSVQPVNALPDDLLLLK